MCCKLSLHGIIHQAFKLQILELTFHTLYSAGYTGLDYQIAALLADRGETLKITGAHNIDTRQALAAEIARSLNKDEATLITLG